MDQKTRVRLNLLLRLFCLSITALFSLTAALAIRRERVVDAWRPTNYVVNLRFDDRLTEIVEARAEINILAVKKLSLVDLDFGDLTVDSVILNASSAPFEQKNETLAVHLPVPLDAGTTFTVTVLYHGKPKDGLILTTDKDGKPSAVGDNWPNRVHNWIPCLDHPSAKATITFNITAPARELVVANGRLASVATNADGNRTWSYTEAVPIPPYCMIVAVGEFASLMPGQPAITPLSFYVPQFDKQVAVDGFAPATSALQLFTQTVAPYPYEKLALIVGATRFGGMENSSAIVFPNTLFSTNPNARVSTAFGIPIGTVDVISHEIAHQWFGDSVTESTWSDLWLSEGFATYFASLFLQRYEGEQAFQESMKHAAETCFAYEKKNRIPIFDRDTEDLFKLLNPNNYQKGAWVLHMLRTSLGDDVFFRGIKNYYDAHKNSTADTEDLRRALEGASGKDLKDFFARWVYESGHPQYELTWEWQGKQLSLRFVLRQLQSDRAFSNPIAIDIITPKGKRRITINPVNKNTVKVIRLEEQPSEIVLDPDSTVLKEATVKKSG